MGLVGVAIGAVWIGQGVGSIHGSFMTGHSQYTALGVILVVLGAVMLVWAGLRARGRGRVTP